jgi:TM2 domain-containing membrane protein YozV
MNSGPQNEYGWTQGNQGDYTSPQPGPAQPGPAQPAGDALALPQVQAQPQWSGQPYAQAAVPVVAPKNGAIGVLLSFFIPGLGSMVNGNVGIGALILGIYVVGWILTIVLIGFPIIFGVWIWGMIDGYTSAQKWNRAHGILS